MLIANFVFYSIVKQIYSSFQRFTVFLKFFNSNFLCVFLKFSFLCRHMHIMNIYFHSFN